MPGAIRIPAIRKLRDLHRSEFQHPEDLPSISKIWQKCISNQATSCRMEFRFVHPPDGRVVWVLVQWEPEVDEEGAVQSFVGAVTDITERVENQKKQLQEVKLLFYFRHPGRGTLISHRLSGGG